MKPQGFTIIDLMVALALIAVLTAIAIPSYQSHMEKAKISEALNMVGPFEVGVVECSQENTSESTVGCSIGAQDIPELQQGSYGAVSDVIDGTIIYTFDSRAGEALNGSVMTFTPEISAGGSYIWHHQLTTPGVDTTQPTDVVTTTAESTTTPAAAATAVEMAQTALTTAQTAAIVANAAANAAAASGLTVAERKAAVQAANAARAVAQTAESTAARAAAALKTAERAAAKAAKAAAK